jgi:multidrug efflux pump subunit AcrB
MTGGKLGFAGRVAQYFINSKLTPLLMVFSILLGACAVLETPREEEPQIIVPMMDVFVEMPGATAQEVEQRVATPMEKLLWEIPGVEYVYSTSRPGMCMAIVRFKVGEKEEDSIVKLYNKLYSNFDLIPPGASKPLIKPRSIDDVPVLALTFWSDRYDSYTLRRIAAEVDREVKSIDDVSGAKVTGGEQRQLRVLLDPAKMAGYGVAPASIHAALEHANQQLQVGNFAAGNREFAVQTGDFLHNAQEVGAVVIGVSAGRPIAVRDVAEIRDGPAEPSEYVLFGLGRNAGAAQVVAPAFRPAPADPSPATAGSGQGLKVGATPLSTPAVASVAMGEYPAVTLSVAKRKGKNAVLVADRVLEKVNDLKATLIPSGVQLTVTRNYGETAQEKSNELLKHLLLAILSVTALIALALGWRSSMLVLAAVPVTLALTLFLYFIYGYTLNRVTFMSSSTFRGNWRRSKRPPAPGWSATSLTHPS